ncbi:Dynein heavy chain 8, axonemal [Merluccius polli]|uniref:Dynein heavy chain 8, axonemal n=1 Tax=Merluccius polli TaxID=89951 RepID=A0AA47M2P7_MERPO|nr:Dynein heavy chain 8, axonemal [Merluccius polli]
MEQGAIMKRASKFCRSGSSVQTPEFLKTVRYKEAREARRKELNSSHKYIFQVLADRLYLEVTAVEEFILDSSSLAPFDNFFAQGGCKTISFVYQESEVPGIECGRSFPGTAKGTKIKRLILTTLSGVQGLCCFFLRSKVNTPINPETIDKEIFFSMFDCTAGILQGIRDLYSKILIPSMNAKEDWGVLSQSKHREGVIEDFKDTLSRYVNFLDDAQLSIEGTVNLSRVTDMDLSRLVSYADMKAAAADHDKVHQLEELLMHWNKQIKQVHYITPVSLHDDCIEGAHIPSPKLKSIDSNEVLTESEQIRRDVESSGPLSELQHWRRMSAKLNSIIEQNQGPECKAVITVLIMSRSKTLKVQILWPFTFSMDSAFKNVIKPHMWRELDARITYCANEAKENVKFLYTLEKVCQSPYNCDPLSMKKNIQNLIDAILMIQSVSSYYSSESMASLFNKVIIVFHFIFGIISNVFHEKVANQMVTTCRAYITNNGTCLVWDQDTEVVIQKIKDCISLYQEYQSCFHKTNKQMEQAGEKPLKVSEMYIFSIFKVFCKRLEKISKMLTVVKTLSVLGQSTIEGIEILAREFQNILINVKRRKYNILSPSDKEFEAAFVDFMAQTDRLENQLKIFINGCFSKILSSQQALSLLQRFQMLDMPCLQTEITNTVGLILQHYVSELEYVNKLYQEDKDDPPLGRNMPPVAGRLGWVKQLYRRIEEPIFYINKNSDILLSPEGKEVVKMYNKTAALFVQYELLYHRAWMRQDSQLEHALHTTLLVRHPKTGKLLVNFDPIIMENIREAKCMLKMGLEVPKHALRLVMSESTINANCLHLETLLADYESSCQNIPTVFRNLMAVKIRSVESILQQGLVLLTWSSFLLDKFFKNVDAALADLNCFLKKVLDFCEIHIYNVLQDISETMLIDLQDQPSSLQDLIDNNTSRCKDWSEALNQKSRHVEGAVKELINTFNESKDTKRTVKKPTQEHRHVAFPLEDEDPSVDNDTNSEPQDGEKEDDFEKECKVMTDHFSAKLLDALVKATKLSLNTLKRRVCVSSSKSDLIMLVKSEIHLTIPNVVIIPSLDDIHQAINRLLQLVMEISQGIACWGQKGKVSNFYQSVVEHKDISEYWAILNSAIKSLRKPTSNALKQFDSFKAVWAENRNQTVKTFMDSSPYLTQIKAELQHYASVEQEIEDVVPVIILGCIELSTAPLKMSLTVEAKAWKILLCKYLKEVYNKKMMDISTFTEKQLKQLSRPIVDLEDVRFAMEVLSKIRDNEIHIDMDLGPIEEAYGMLSASEVEVTQTEAKGLDTLRYSFIRLQSKARSVQDELVRVQPKFKQNLLESVTIFHTSVSNFIEQYETKGPMVAGIPPQEASTRLQICQATFDDLWRKYITYSSGEQLFGLPVTEYEPLEKTRKELSLLQKLYGLYDAVMNNINDYYDICWTDVDVEKINAELQEFQNRCRRLPKGLKDWQAFLDLKKRVDDFSESCPLLEMMANKSMKQRHWNRITDLTMHTFDVESESFALKNIMEAPLLQHKEDIEDICISAVKENDIEAKLAQVVDIWSSQILSFMSFKDRGELMLKGTDTAEVVTAMEDSLMVLGSLMSNRYNAPFKKDIQKWVFKLSSTSDIIEQWLNVQNLWVYLEAVFVGGDIAKQLPQEAKRFQNIDKSWIKIMVRAHKVANVVQCCVGDTTMDQLLPYLLEQLDLCQKSLTGYLEKKRLWFPRFFFVSDPALLEILGQASDSHTIQSHLLGVFDNVNEVEFHVSAYDKIMAVISQEGEKVELDVPVLAQGPVELWLGELQMQQQTSLHSVIKAADLQINDPGFELLTFLNTFQAQVGLLGIQMLWTRDAEMALKKATEERKIMSHTNQKFLDLLNTLISQTTHDLSKFDRIKFETLVTIHVHQRDIFDDLVKLQIKSVNDFEWLKQSRFYYKEDLDHVIVSITDVDFIYQNEFLGCTDRLVITPLTDRCYITLSQALGMSMGGAPAGPAGTGKTETTKDMGRCLGKYVVVFNCSDQMDFRGLGRIYKGLAQSGSWGCFDEFNRIDLPVLSVAAQQIYIVLMARKECKSTFIFTDGDCVNLNPEFGLFITMNPGYAGRQELPENLKVQFRSVAMMVPDRQIIMRVKLASCGFIENIILAQKFFVLYKLCEEQLTKQVHYDFGLRNILSVLRTLGANKRARPDDTESSIVMRVLRDMNLSKLVDEDEPLFLSLISDLFPGIQLDGSTYEDLQAAVANQVELAGIVNHPPWNLKLVQLYETARVRHGLMTLGPSGAGKTMVINILMRALTECGTPHREMRMNPKAITAPQMFGRLDASTNDWTDGIFSTLWRKTLKAKKGECIWIVLDGPVDAIWIENLNSVLDDNKTLTLANGDRITMSPYCKLVFEVHNMDNASPATVSRMGMVFMSSSALSWRPILQGWANKQNAQEAGNILSLYDKIFEDTYVYMKQNLKPKMELLECNYIMQSVNLLEGLIPSKEAGGLASSMHLQRLFLFCLMWSLGALLELEDRDKLEAFIKEHSSKMDVPNTGPEETMFEYMVNSHGEWDHWDNYVVEYLYPTDHVPDYASILVPNVDNTRTSFLLETIAKQRKAVLLIGEQGTAKTVMIKGYTKKYDPETDLFKSLNFSSATEPMMFQRTVESYIEKRMGSTFGPPGGRRMTIFVDDINMPIVNEWGDQITNEIVRQMMEMSGMYSVDKPGDFTTIVDVQLLAAMIHPGGGRNDIPQRLKRQYTVFNCTLPSNTSIDKIFGVMGCGYFHECREFQLVITDMVRTLVSAGRILWQRTKVKMLPTPSKFHYVFNLRDLSRIWQGMLKINAGECNDVSTLLALFKCECIRVIADRFVCIEDKVWFEKAVSGVIQEHMDPSLVSELHTDPYFVDFLREAPEPTGDEGEDACFDAPKIYELVFNSLSVNRSLRSCPIFNPETCKSDHGMSLQVPGFDFLSEKLRAYQAQHNEAVRGTSLDLVFFTDAMTHLVKISRIIRTDGGNALLVGVGGSGKQSLTRLASFIAGYSIFQITLTRTYNIINLMDDLKLLYRTAGADGKGITFIFTDNEIKDEAFLEYLNNVLSSGEVSNLFAKDEIDEITQNLISVMKKELPRVPPTFDNLYDYFISRARKNLHVVLCFSPVGEKFRSRSLKFPGLISGCTMDWFTPWPHEALVAVSNHFLSDFPMVCSPDVKVAVVSTMGTYHDKVSHACDVYFERFRRRTHVTPKSYLSFISGYKTLYAERHNYINTLAERMNIGLAKLMEASESVAELSKVLVVKEKELAVATIKAEKVLTEVTVSAEAASIVKNQVQKVKDKALKIVEGIEKEKAFAETIKPSDISTVRKLAKPPHLIMRIMDCGLLLFQKKLDPVTMDPERPCLKPSWREALKLMSASGFMASLMQFPKDTINEEMVELLEPYLNMEDYTLENAKKVCGSVAGLLSWTQAMATFFGINQEVLPLKANLIVQEGRLTVANAQLAKAQAQLDEKQAELDKVQAKFDAAMKEKQDLLDDAEMCRNKMTRASALIDGLSGEKVRWTEQSKEFKAQINRQVQMKQREFVRYLHVPGKNNCCAV